VTIAAARPEVSSLASAGVVAEGTEAADAAVELVTVPAALTYVPAPVG
jgi:hypothetical protein